MEPLTTTAIVSVLFSKAFEKSGEKLGETFSAKIGQLLTLIQEKFKAESIEGKLQKVQEEPSEKNKSRFEQELTTQMGDDEVFAKKLKALIDEIKSNNQVNQIFFRSVSVKGNAEIGSIEQTTTQGRSVTQEAITQVDVGGTLKIGNMNQKS